MLKDYSEKRNFEITSEPKPGEDPTSKGPLTFVVQKHAASHLHYDFRLELNGVLVSWAVPKGPSLDPKQRRLAVRVEDHPVAYGSFEGTIPQGEYGGGEVIVWDRGTYKPKESQDSREDQEKLLSQQLADGKIDFILHGEKLKGTWVLVHTRENQWLLIKGIDEFASLNNVLSDDKSVASNTRIEESGQSPVHPFEPMLLTEVSKPFVDDEWSFELKLDGFRAIATLQNQTVSLTTRNGKDVTDRFPVIVAQLKTLAVESAVLDGEIVQFDSEGRPDFQSLAQPFQKGWVTTADFCIFDLLLFKGQELLNRPLRERQKILETLDIHQPNLKRLDMYPTDGVVLFDAATKMGFEGVVGKRLESTYQPGKRSKDWVKVKIYHSEEFVVVGFTQGLNARAKTIGALLLAQHSQKGLTYAGKVGAGFSDDQLTELASQLPNIKTDKSPLITVPDLPGITWVKPQLFVEVRFMSRTKEGMLRFPIFLRTRPDIATQAPAANAKKLSEDELATPIKEQLNTAKDEIFLEMNGHKIHFSHLDRELWPGVKKRDLAVYYTTVREPLLQYLKDRPLSFVRCPDGVTGEIFFQKHWDRGRPEYVETVSIYSDANKRARDFVMCNNLETLLWLSQMSVVELNPWNSRDVIDGNPSQQDLDFSTDQNSLESSILNRPDYIVLDLDPHFGGKATGWNQPEWLRLVEVARFLRQSLKEIGMKCFPKSSGKSGLHIFVPVAREYTYDQIRVASITLGENAIKHLGGKVTLEWNLKKRPEGVFIDVNQNVRGKTMVAPYSPRASKQPGVSMPLNWDELETVDPTKFTVLTAPDRLAEKGDLWSDALGLKQHLFS